MSEQYEAGRETDALVAREVMGYPGAAEGGWDDPRHLADGRVLPGLTPLPYSTDIAAAFTVMEHLRARRIYLSLDACHDRYESDAGWEGSLVKGEDFWMQALGVAPTAPLAICIAALRAVALTRPQLTSSASQEGP